MYTKINQYRRVLYRNWIGNYSLVRFFDRERKNNLTFRQFQYLDQDSQEQLFLEQSVQVAERDEPGYIFHLYQIYSFYIEVQYNTTLNSLQSFIAFDSMVKLDPYLPMINVQGLLK